MCNINILVLVFVRIFEINISFSYFVVAVVVCQRFCHQSNLDYSSGFKELLLKVRTTYKNLKIFVQEVFNYDAVSKWDIVLVGNSYSLFVFLAFAENQACLYGGRLQGGQTNVRW